MEPENLEPQVKVEQKSTFFRVTPFSKYAAMVLFIALPFIGGWIGYTYAPEKIVEVERVIKVEKETEAVIETDLSASPFAEVIVNNWEGSRYKFLSKDNTLYILVDEPTGLGVDFVAIEDLTSDTNFYTDELEYIGGDYITVNDQVIFLLGTPHILAGADAESFDIFERSDRQSFGVDDSSVYFRDQKLDGVDPQAMNFIENDSYNLAIVHDTDTYWYPAGSCHFGTYRQGTAEELATYQFPCQ